MESSFHWKWYYAFQQVGDQQAAELSQAYRDSIVKKDDASGILSLISPPMLTQRLMLSLADTDVEASLAYEQSVRDFHGSLREFFYPLLFKKGDFNSQELVNIPTYSPNRAH